MSKPIAFASGDRVQVLSTQFKGMTGAVEKVGSFPCMNGAYVLKGIKVQLNGMAGPVILDASQVELFEAAAPADNWFFAELEVV